MGLSLFPLSASIYEGHVARKLGEPDPRFFTTKKIHVVGSHLVAVVHYPQAANFEGIKILVYKNMTEETFNQIALLDPHFSETGPSPFARFEPTESGLTMALNLCRIMK